MAHSLRSARRPSGPFGELKRAAAFRWRCSSENSWRTSRRSHLPVIGAPRPAPPAALIVARSIITAAVIGSSGVTIGAIISRPDTDTDPDARSPHIDTCVRLCWRECKGAYNQRAGHATGHHNSGHHNSLKSVPMLGVQICREIRLLSDNRTQIFASKDRAESRRASPSKACQAFPSRIYAPPW